MKTSKNDTLLEAIPLSESTRSLLNSIFHSNYHEGKSNLYDTEDAYIAWAEFLNDEFRGWIQENCLNIRLLKPIEFSEVSYAALSLRGFKKYIDKHNEIKLIYLKVFGISPPLQINGGILDLCLEGATNG